MLKTCGPAILTTKEVVQEMTAILLAVLGKQHPCQQDLGDDADADDLQESSEYDWLVIDNALDTVTGLAIALGPTFAELWKLFEKPIMKYAGSSEPAERSSSVGAIAECIGGMGEAVTPYTSVSIPTLPSPSNNPSTHRLTTTPSYHAQRLLKLLLHRLSDEDPSTKSHAAFAAGLLCEKSASTAEIRRAYAPILGKVEPLFGQAENLLTDNAAGCVSRMIGRYPELVPLAHVLPVLVAALPLKGDYGENEAVWGMVVKLCMSFPSPHSPPLPQYQTHDNSPR